MEICQSAARLSGTIDPRTIATVEDASGRVALLADLVRAAWEEIQNEYRAWRFLTVDIPATAVLGEGIEAFTAGALNINDWAEWIPGIDEDTIPVTVWPAGASATLRNEEAELSWSEYRDFRLAYQTGTGVSTPAARPQAFSVDTQDRLVVWPVPDRDYRIAGTYRRAPQQLSNDADVPIIAQQYQDTIVWAGTLLLHRHDEAETNVLVTTQQGVNSRMAALRRRYLKPTKVLREPLGAGRTGSVRPLSPASPT